MSAWFTLAWELRALFFFAGIVSLEFEFFKCSLVYWNSEFEEDLEFEEDGDFEFEEKHRKIHIYKT